MHGNALVLLFLVIVRFHGTSLTGKGKIALMRVLRC